MVHFFILYSFQELEQQESNFWSICEHWRSDLEAEISELDHKTSNIEFSGSCFNNLDQHLNDSMEKLNRAKIVSLESLTFSFKLDYLIHECHILNYNLFH